MKLANIVLQLDKIGTSVPKKNVSPAEVMFLVSDHHTNSGKDPIVKLDETPDDAEDAPLAKLQDDLDALESAQAKLDLLTNLTDEVREKREKKLRAKMDVVKDAMEKLRSIKAMRSFTPAIERRRLISIYGLKRINSYFPGQIPQLPQDFAEARGAGIGTVAPSERLLTVGDQAVA